MKILPYNVLKLDDGSYTVYLPEHPVVGCPVKGSRSEAHDLHCREGRTDA